MAYRAPKRPSASVVIVARDAEATITRALESVLAQRFEDVQAVVCVRPSRDRTASICTRMAERDIRIDVVEVDSLDRGAAVDAALELVRGTHLVFMEATDWFGPQGLEQLVLAAREDDLAVAVPTFSFDERARTGELASRVARPVFGRCDSLAEFRAHAGSSIDQGTFCLLAGKLLLTDRVRSLGLSMAAAGGDAAFMAAYAEDVDHVGSVMASVFHTPAPAPSRIGRGAYEECEREHELLLGLAGHWGMDGDPVLLQAIHGRHLRHVVSCIEGVCSQRKISSIERADRVRDIIEAASTRETVEALQGIESASHGAGLLFAPIAKGNVIACCVGARFSNFAHAARLPFVPRRSAAI